MPAKKQITKEAILDAAFEIVRREGMEALNMRSLANMCNCSTQPIYLSFSGAEEVKKAVAKKITAYFDDFVRAFIAEGNYPEYKSMGMGYIKFAREEKQLFRYLFMCERNSETEWEQKSFSDDVSTIVKNYGMSENDARTLHAEMWVFVHGIATMCATGYLEWEPETVSRMVSDAYCGLTSKLNNGENKNGDK